MAENCNTTPKPKNTKEFFKSWYFWKPFLGIVLGGSAGFLYYYFVGCTTGACGITSSVWGSAITGSILGFLITSSPCTTCK